MEYVWEFGVFTGKVVILVAGILVVISALATLATRHRHKEQLEVQCLNDKYKAYSRAIKSRILSKKAIKADLKKLKKQKKKKAKEDDQKRSIYVLEFHGDIRASAAHTLCEEVTAVLSVAKEGDEAVVKVESPGGVVHGYGLAAAQLDRFRERNIKLTICVDKVAASGGYMMACTGDQILAAPFAIVGSIGVLAQVPNFNKVLKKHDIDYQEITSGEYKRTLSIFGEVTEKGKQKFTEQIEETHELFKQFIQNRRPKVDLSKVATGEYWFGTQAKQLDLVDEILTSDEYLFRQKDVANLYKVSLLSKKNIGEKLSDVIGKGVASGFDKVLERLVLKKDLSS